MTAKQILAEIRKLIVRHDRSESEKTLYEELCAEAEGWEMRYQEIEEEEEE